MKLDELKYLKRLAGSYPTIASAAAEIINLQSVLNLPKGTEHFLTDIHGEYDAFSHVLRNGSGSVRKKIDDVFGHTLGTADKRALATLIYYPQGKMELIKQTEGDMQNWYKVTLYRLIEVCKTVSSKYTRSKVRKSLPKEYAYVIEELITEKAEVLDKEAYYESIVNTIIDIGGAEDFIVALSNLIQRLVVDHLHILGDIYDRGPGPHFIMDKLMEYHSLDIQWGNHDIVWMGAAAGQMACIATIIRTCARYGNLDILEDGYGINLLPLATFAMNTYGGDPCSCFCLKDNDNLTNEESRLNVMIHKAISILQFKLEGQLIEKYDCFDMKGRRMLHRINFATGTIFLEGKEYEMLDMNFPTIDPADPYELSEEEKDVMKRLRSVFLKCDKLQAHVQLLLNKGSLYKVYNNNLLYHGCMPLNEDGSFRSANIFGEWYKGKELYDVLETYVRKAFFARNPIEKEKGADIMWYIWTGPNSPLYGKDKMTTFERYFIAEKETHREAKNSYYSLLENEKVVDQILEEFGLHADYAHIINGHVPVQQKAGESPIKCNGKVLVIDGGFSKAYQKMTGIAGYTLISNSYGLILAAHQPFTSIDSAIEEEIDIQSKKVAVQQAGRRLLVGDTDKGAVLREEIEDLKKLMEVYRSGLIIESDNS